MQRFRFKIVDSQGRRRSGVLRAESLEVAETGLRSKLCQIELLEPLPGEGAAVEVRNLTESFSQVDRIRKVVGALVACVLLVSLYAGWRQLRSEPVLEVSNEKVQFAVKGQVRPQSLPAGADPSSIKVHVTFPDLAYEVEGRLSEDGTSFELPVDLVGNSRPERMVLELSVDGKPGRWPIPSGTRGISGSGDVVLNQVVVDVEQVAGSTIAVPKLPSRVALADHDARKRAKEGRSNARARANAKEQRGHGHHARRRRQ